MKSKSTRMSKILKNALAVFIALGTFSFAAFAEKYKGQLHEALVNPDVPPGQITQMLEDNPDWISRYVEDGWLPIHIAAQYARPEILQILLDHGADINSIGPERHTPLYYALHPDFNTPWFGHYEFHKESLKWLVAHGATLGAGVPSPLFEAFAPPTYGRGGCRNNHFALADLKLFLEAGFPIDSEDSEGATPFFWALRNTDLHGVNTDNFNCLLSYHPNVAHKDHKGRNAFHYLAQNDSCIESSDKHDWNITKLCSLFLDSGVNINEKDADGNTPLHLAAKESGYVIGGAYQYISGVAFLKLLIELGADPHILNNAGQTFIDCCGNSTNYLKLAFTKLAFPNEGPLKRLYRKLTGDVE